MTQERLAELSGVSTGYIGLIEIGRRRPTVEALRSLAKALDADYASLAVLANYQDADSDLPLLPVEPGAFPIVKRLVRRLTVDQWKRLEAAAGLLTAAPDPHVESRDPLTHPALEEAQMGHEPSDVGADEDARTTGASQ